MKRIIYLWAIVAGGACAALGVTAFLNKRQKTTQLEFNTAAHTACLSLQEQLSKRISEAETVQKTIESSLPGKPPKKPTELSDKERFDRRLVKNDATEQKPEIRARNVRFYRRMYQKEYGDLYDELNLPPEKLEKFKQLIVDKQMTYSDAATLLAAQGISSFSETGRNAIEAAKDKVDQDIRALLGDEAYQTYQEHDRLQGTMAQLTMYEGALAEKGVQALDKHQLRALATACCDVADEARNPDYAAIAKDKAGPVATQQILQRAGPQLTLEQTQAFIAYREESGAAEKASAKFIRGEAPLPPAKESKSM